MRIKPKKPTNQVIFLTWSLLLSKWRHISDDGALSILSKIFSSGLSCRPGVILHKLTTICKTTISTKWFLKTLCLYIFAIEHNFFNSPDYVVKILLTLGFLSTGVNIFYYIFNKEYTLYQSSTHNYVYMLNKSEILWPIGTAEMLQKKDTLDESSSYIAKQNETWNFDVPPFNILAMQVPNIFRGRLISLQWPSFVFVLGTWISCTHPRRHMIP